MKNRSENQFFDTSPDLNQLPHIFAKYPEIDAVYLFGSLAEKRAHKKSDIDLGIVPNTTRIHDKHLEILSELARKGFCHVDLVYMDVGDIVLKYEVIRLNQILYKKDGFDSGSLYSKILRQYFDFLPYLKIQRQALKHRIIGKD